MLSELCIAVTVTSRRQMTGHENHEIEHVISLWHYLLALWDCSMKMMHFCVETLVSVLSVKLSLSSAISGL